MMPGQYHLSQQHQSIGNVFWSGLETLQYREAECEQNDDDAATSQQWHSGTYI
jgi:hypothetical protein